MPVNTMSFVSGKGLSLALYIDESALVGRWPGFSDFIFVVHRANIELLVGHLPLLAVIEYRNMIGLPLTALKYPDPYRHHLRSAPRRLNAIRAPSNAKKK